MYWGGGAFHGPEAVNAAGGGGEGLVKDEQVTDRQNVMEEWKCVGG